MQTITEDLEQLTQRQIGLIGEQLACKFVENRGYEILERNWTCSIGEVDLIARDGEETAFIEIKTRLQKADEGAYPELAITQKKRDKYKKLIAAYCASHPNIEAARFDAVGISLESQHTAHVHYVLGITLDEQ